MERSARFTQAISALVHFYAERAQHAPEVVVRANQGYDYEILYHPGKAKMVANALSIKERLKMKMYLGRVDKRF